MNKFLVLLHFVLLCFSSLSAQIVDKSTVRGTVQSDAGEVLPAATVFLIADFQTQAIVAHAITDEKGAFVLEAPAGEYLLGVSFLGFEMHHSKVVLAGETLELGTVRLKEQTNELQTVVVRGEMMTVKSRPDGFIVNVKELRERSNDALDLLKRLPQISVKGTDLKVVGKKNVVVKIGNVLQRVSSEELASVLKSYDAGLIQQVEVLMQPPLRYDTDGNTAMIILHTSSVFKEYMGGIIGTELMYGENNNTRYGGYGSLLYNKKKLFLSFDPSANRNTTGMDEEAVYQYSNREYSVVTPSDGKSFYAGGRFNLQYEYADKKHFGLLVSLNRRKRDNEFQSYEQTTPASLGIPSVTNENKYLSRKPKFTATAYWENLLGKRHQVWTELSYYRLTDKSETGYSGVYEKANTPFFTYADNDRLRTAGWSFSHDYSFVLDKEKESLLETGIKALYSITDNDRNHTQWMEGTPAETFTQRNGIRLHEWLVSPYVSTTFRFTPQWWMRAGVRLSTTSSRLNEHGRSDNPYHTHTSFLPSFHVAYTPSASHKLSFTLNSSIKQPNFSHLNPFEWKVNRRIIEKGNPDLLPETHYNYDVTYTYKGVLSISGKIKQGRKRITSVSTMQGETIYRRTENAENSLFRGFTVDYYFDKLKWMNISFNAYYGKTTYTSLYDATRKRTSGKEWGAELYFDFTFNKARTFTGYLSGNYVGRKYTTLAVIEPDYEVGGGISYSMLKRRLAFSLAGISVVSASYRGVSERDGYRILFDNNYGFPTLYFSVSYKFSNAKSKSLRKSMTTREVEMRF